MPVDTTHRLYDQFAPSWQRTRDVLAGEDAVKAAGEAYIPRLETQTDEEYQQYVARGFFYNATARTLAGYLGMIFRRDPAVNSPADGDRAASLLGVSSVFSSFLEDVDLFGTTLASYARHLATEVLSVGRGGTLVDWHEGMERRAFLAFYSAENILNWRVARINGRMQPTLVVLREWAAEINGDEFEEELKEQILVQRLEAVGDGAPTLPPSGAVGTQRPTYVYRVEKWEQREKQDAKDEMEWVRVSVATPTRNGKTLSSIPFVFHGPTHSRADVERSPIDDIVVANLDHFRINVEFKHGMHFTALPTAWVSGFDKTTTLKIGSRTAWVADIPGASAGFLEFKGEGLQTFERALDRVERLLAVLGSRLLESQKRVSESAEALALRQGGEASILGSLATSLSSSLTDVMRWVYWWHTVTADPSDVSEETACVKLNTDFETAHMTGKDLTALVAAWQAGAISQDTMLFQFRQGEILPPGRTVEEEKRIIGLDDKSKEDVDALAKPG